MTISRELFGLLGKSLGLVVLSLITFPVSWDVNVKIELAWRGEEISQELARLKRRIADERR